MAGLATTTVSAANGEANGLSVISLASEASRYSTRFELTRFRPAGLRYVETSIKSSGREFEQSWKRTKIRGHDWLRPKPGGKKKTADAMFVDQCVQPGIVANPAPC
jgi:hypothetical protein